MSVYERTVFLESDFEVGPGPAFHVYLVPKANIRANADVPGTMFIDLGRPALVPGQPALCHSGRRRPQELSERRDLVRAVQRVDLARRPHSGPALDGFRRRFRGHLAAAACAGRGRGAVRHHSRRHRRLRHRRAAAARSGADDRRASRWCRSSPSRRCSPMSAGCWRFAAMPIGAAQRSRWSPRSRPACSAPGAIRS